MENPYKLYTDKDFVESFKKNYDFAKINKGEICTQTIENGVIMPYKAAENTPAYGGVFDKNFNLIKNSVTATSSFLGNFSGDIVYNYGRLDSENINTENYMDLDVVFIGFVYGRWQYGHFLVETLSRLWFFLEENNKKYKIAYICENNQDEYFFDFFELMGLKREQFIKIEKPTKFKNIIVPEQSIRISDYVHNKYLETIDKIKQNVQPKKYEKVYFSRTKLEGASKTFGEENIESVFKKNGYKIFYPEKLSIYEQISILKGCKKFAGVCGTALHNAIFADNGIECVYLNRSEDVCSPQLLIDKIKKNSTYYVDAYIKILPTYFCCCPCLLGLNPHLEEFFNNFNFKYNKKSFYKTLKDDSFKFFLHWSNMAIQWENVTKIINKENIDKIVNNFQELYRLYPIHRIEPQKSIFKKLVNKIKRRK